MWKRIIEHFRAHGFAGSTFIHDDSGDALFYSISPSAYENFTKVWNKLPANNTGQLYTLDVDTADDTVWVMTIKPVVESYDQWL